jgi:hypothetical protein
MEMNKYNAAQVLVREEILRRANDVIEALQGANEGGMEFYEGLINFNRPDWAEGDLGTILDVLDDECVDLDEDRMSDFFQEGILAVLETHFASHGVIPTLRMWLVDDKAPEGFDLDECDVEGLRDELWERACEAYSENWREVCEWYFVSGWLLRHLKDAGHVVHEELGIWGRQGTGQAIAQDSGIQALAMEMDFLKRYEAGQAQQKAGDALYARLARATADKTQELESLRAELSAQGGRGVGLVDSIDRLEAELDSGSWTLEVRITELKALLG